ncbi:MAG: Mur ligase family protein [Proteobacteria bacterium]|nr:Mur ligase family protein [Pseudomonadota bacterium]MDA1136198.1 Mur ligase family protein [Pseudomonadota bacterium]
MTYNIYSKTKLAETLNRMFSLHPKLIDFNLSRLEELMAKFSNPENKLSNVIHIAGTNGKGSTSSFLKEILEAHNLSVNVYTSPHLINFNERIRIKGTLITDILLNDILTEIEFKNQNKPITFFEITTAAAFISFFRDPADFNIIETGLGGRLDATNIIKEKRLCLITKIGYDHLEYLGPKIQDIAFEKSGILRKNTPLIISHQDNQEAFHVIKDQALKLDIDIIKTINLSKNTIIGLKGDHQYENASTALTAAYNLIPNISKEKVQFALTKTLWHGRIEEIKTGKILKYRNNITILDGAHNIDGAIALANFLKKQPHRKWNFIIGMLNNRNIIDFIINFREHINIIYTIPIRNQNSSSNPGKLSLILNKAGLISYPTTSLEKALIKSDKELPLLITGSLYLAGEVLSFNDTKIT